MIMQTLFDKQFHNYKYILPRRSSAVVFDFSSLLDIKLSKRSNHVDRLPDDKADNKRQAGFASST
jgi:hypothetical protein